MYKIVFLQNYFNLYSYQQRIIPGEKSEEFRLNQICSDKIAKIVWKTEDEKGKEYWRSLGIATKDGGGGLYLLVKINGNFHKLLRYANIV